MNMQVTLCFSNMVSFGEKKPMELPLYVYG